VDHRCNCKSKGGLFEKKGLALPNDASPGPGDLPRLSGGLFPGSLPFCSNMARRFLTPPDMMGELLLQMQALKTWRKYVAVKSFKVQEGAECV
jgi:hypothetical protein